MPIVTQRPWQSACDPRFRRSTVLNNFCSSTRMFRDMQYLRGEGFVKTWPQYFAALSTKQQGLLPDLLVGLAVRLILTIRTQQSDTVCVGRAGAWRGLAVSVLPVSEHFACRARDPGTGYQMMRDTPNPGGEKGLPDTQHQVPLPPRGWGRLQLPSPGQVSHWMTTATWVGAAKTRKLGSQAHPKCRIVSKQLLFSSLSLGRLIQQK